MVDVTLEDGTVEKRYIVYVLDSTSYQTLLFGKTALVNTLIGECLGNGAYYTTKFDIYRYENGERKIAISIKESDLAIAGISQYDMVYPGGYNVDGDVLTYQVFPTLVEFTADQVVAIGNDIYNEEVYKKYGLDLDKDRLEAGTDTNYTKFYIKTMTESSEETEITIYVSDLFVLEDASTCYFAYIPAQHEIVQLSSDTFKWLNWSFGEYVDLRMFFEYISSLDYFSVLTSDGKTDARFKLTGNAFNYHVKVTSADESTVLKDKNGNEIVFDAKYDDTLSRPTFVGDFENFRDLYYVLITRMLDGTEAPVKIADDAECKLTVIAQSIQRDRDQQYYRYENGEVYYDENGKRPSYTYEGGYMIVQNLTYTNSFGTKIKYDVAYYDESVGKFFIKTKDSNDNQEKPRDFTYTEDKKLVPLFINATDATAEYTTVTYEYKFYDLYSEFTNADGVTETYLNQTYMLVVPTTTTTVWRIEADGTRTMVSEDVSDNGNMGSYIRKTSIEKLVSDTNKIINGMTIDKWGI